MKQTFIVELEADNEIKTGQIGVPVMNALKLERIKVEKSAQQSVEPTLLHAGCGGEIVQTKPYCKKCRVVELQSG